MSYKPAHCMCGKWHTLCMLQLFMLYTMYKFLSRTIILILTLGILGIEISGLPSGSGIAWRFSRHVPSNKSIRTNRWPKMQLEEWDARCICLRKLFFGLDAVWHFIHHVTNPLHFLRYTGNAKLAVRTARPSIHLFCILCYLLDVLE